MKEKKEWKTTTIKISKDDYQQLLLNVLTIYTEGKIKKNSLSHYLAWSAREGAKKRLDKISAQ
jgi:hypothetical protein